MLHSKQWHYSLHRDFQNCYSTRRSLTRFFKAPIPTPILHVHITENSTCRRQRALRILQSSSRNSTHRRQGDLLEMHPSYKTFKATPVAPETFRTFQSFMTFQPSRQFYNVPVSPGNPPRSSILQLECIFYNFYSSIGFHRNSTEYQLGNYRHYKHYIQRKGDVAISVKMSR